MFIKNLKNISYKFIVLLLMAISIGVPYFVSIPLFAWSLGCFIDGKFGDGLLIFILCLLLIVLSVGASEIIERHDIGWKS